ncbi:class I SAM-dependent methyltransferase [Actinomycetospora chiangmaiensis]|uniref:class I SAM-dependent methyltransferase n=1 Tax=Actinomycetospora chiangmaiensis TaxID=402650 RepID=UPI0009FBE460|nr:class I SAM-dependent methyltransferase [Actinomycetospora chiangmaiensis]
MSLRQMIESSYPEVGAGGYTRCDGTVEFYLRVRAVCPVGAVVLNFGAGRGKSSEDPVPTRRQMQDLRDIASRVVGADIDEAVLKNNTVTESVVLKGDNSLPFEDNTFDVIVSDFTFEHITDAVRASRELHRVLKPGGWICARTPNLWGYIGLPTNLVPNALHNWVLRKVQPHKQEIDTFPTAYRINTRKQIYSVFPASMFNNFSYTYDSEPHYVGRSRLAWNSLRALNRMLPREAKTMRFIFMQKK